MTRRTLAPLLGGATLAWAQTPGDDLAQWKAEIDRRWQQAQAYTIAALDAMPDEHLNYVAFRGQFSFVKQLTHLAFYNVVLVASIFNEGPLQNPTKYLQPWKEPESPGKDQARDYLERTFIHCRSLTARLTDEDLTRGPLKPFTDFVSVHNGREMVWRALTHTFHHRGQAIVYLRGKGIKPPGYRY